MSPHRANHERALREREPAHAPSLARGRMVAGLRPRSPHVERQPAHDDAGNGDDVGREAYHQRLMLPAPALIAVGFVIALLVLLPARRLQLAGFRGRAIGAYALLLWILGFSLAVRPMATRFLIPILLIAYIAPFVSRRAGCRASPGWPVAAGSRHPRQPMKNVTPPELDDDDRALTDDRHGRPAWRR